MHGSCFAGSQPALDFFDKIDLESNEKASVNANFPGFYNSMSKKPTITAFFEV